MKVFKKILIILAVVSVILAVTATVSLAILQKRTNEINDDISGIYTDERYSDPVFVNGVDVIKQNVSCGYAVIEMFSSWSGHSVTEKSLYDQYGKVVTSTGNSFCKEMNKQFPEYKTTICKYLKNTEYIDAVYESLSDGIPVPFEWAALYDGEWTLHYSLIIGADIPADKLSILREHAPVLKIGLCFRNI